MRHCLKYKWRQNNRVTMSFVVPYKSECRSSWNIGRPPCLAAEKLGAQHSLIEAMSISFVHGYIESRLKSFWTAACAWQSSTQQVVLSAVWGIAYGALLKHPQDHVTRKRTPSMVHLCADCHERRPAQAASKHLGVVTGHPFIETSHDTRRLKSPHCPSVLGAERGAHETRSSECCILRTAP